MDCYCFAPNQSLFQALDLELVVKKAENIFNFYLDSNWEFQITTNATGGPTTGPPVAFSPLFCYYRSIHWTTSSTPPLREPSKNTQTSRAPSHLSERSPLLSFRAQRRNLFVISSAVEKSPCYFSLLLVTNMLPLSCIHTLYVKQKNPGYRRTKH